MYDAYQVNNRNEAPDDPGADPEAVFLPASKNQKAPLTEPKSTTLTKMLIALKPDHYHSGLVCKVFDEEDLFNARIPQKLESGTVFQDAVSKLQQAFKSGN